MNEIPPEIEPFVKSEMSKFHEFLAVLQPELATTKLDKRDIYFITRKIRDGFDIYEMALVLFRDFYKDAPEDFFEDEPINPYNVYVDTPEGPVKLDPKQGIEQLCKQYAFKIAMNLLVEPISFAFLNKSLGGFIPKLLKEVGGEDGDVDKIIKGKEVKI